MPLLAATGLLMVLALAFLLGLFGSISTGGGFQMARDSIEKPSRPDAIGSLGENCFLLEEGFGYLAGGRIQEAERSLLRVRASFDRLEEMGSSFLTALEANFKEERSKPYAGEDHEQIMLDAILALADLLEGGGQAENYWIDLDAPIMTAPDGRRYKGQYRKIGLPAYLLGLLAESKHPPDTKEALLCYQHVQEWEPRFASVREDLERLEQGAPSRPTNGVLYVFSLVGKGPQKVEVEETGTAIAAEIASQFSRLLPELGERFGATLDLSPIRIPRIQPSPGNSISNIEIQIDGIRLGATETLTDVTEAAVQQYNSTRDWILAKALTRRMMKKAVTTAAKGVGRKIAEDAEAPRWAHWLIEAGGAAANTLWSAADRADTRHWQLLPEKVQVLRVELPAGRHEIRWTPRLAGNAAGHACSSQLEIRPQENSYILAILPNPDAPLVLLMSRPPP